MEIKYEGENEMEGKTIEVPAGTSKVTLNIERESERPQEMTLRQALMATPSNRAVIVRVVDSPLVNQEPLAWAVVLLAINGSDLGERRLYRVARFAACELCDVPALLDERPVKAIGIQRSHGTDFVVFEVQAEVRA